MKKIKEIFFSLSAVNVTITLFLAFLSIIALAYFSRVPKAIELLLANAAVVAFIFYLTYKQITNKSKIFSLLGYLFLPALIFIVFKELYFLTDPINGVIYDWELIRIDKFLFGANPTKVLAKIANPLLTEILQLAYSSYYFIPIIIALELFKKNENEKADYMLFFIFYGFFLSYLGYLTLPAIGPRFTLHDFKMLGDELPGLFFTDFLREQINAGEGVFPNTLFPMLTVQRDAFPSGHTEVTLIALYFAVKFKVQARYYLIPIGILLIFATVYLRYHYVVDLIAGVAFAFYTIWTGKYLYYAWENVKMKYGKTR